MAKLAPPLSLRYFGAGSPSLHRDKFSAKVPGSCPVRRQVTPTNFIAGPLAQIFQYVMIMPSRRV